MTLNALQESSGLLTVSCSAFPAHVRATEVSQQDETVSVMLPVVGVENTSSMTPLGWAACSKHQR